MTSEYAEKRIAYYKTLVNRLACENDEYSLKFATEQLEHWIEVRKSIN